MNIEKNVQGNTAVLKVNGWLDTQSAPELEAAVQALDSGTENLVLDCAGLEYISSAGLRQIVAAYKKMQGALTLKNVSEEIMGVIRMTGLDKRMKFE